MYYALTRKSSLLVTMPCFVKTKYNKTNTFKKTTTPSWISWSSSPFTPWLQNDLCQLSCKWLKEHCNSEEKIKVETFSFCESLVILEPRRSPSLFIFLNKVSEKKFWIGISIPFQISREFSSFYYSGWREKELVTRLKCFTFYKDAKIGAGKELLASPTALCREELGAVQD